MSEQENGGQSGAQATEQDGAQAPGGTPQGEGAASGDRPPSYRKMEEDATTLNETERTGEGTGARAGEYS